MEKHIDTKCVQSGYSPKSGQPRITPIVQSTTFFYENPEQLARLFDLKESGYFYSRLSNPTCAVLEEKVAALEGGKAALATSSGQAAITLAALNVCNCGDHIISSSAIYGGTYNLFDVTLRKLGIETTFISPDSTAEEIEKHIRPQTKLIYGETVSNPAISVLNFEGYSNAAKKHGILFMVDNTLSSPIHCRPILLGADIVIHSSTKYIDGHATSLGGIIVDSGNFDFKGNKRYADFNTPDQSYHGLIYSKDCGELAFITKARAQLMRDIGACMSPFNAFLTNLGCETLHLRMERTSYNALEIAKTLSSHQKIEFVKYPFLSSDANYGKAEKYLNGGAGGMLSFGVKGGKEKALDFIKNLSVVANVTHVADLRSSVIHPASTTHRQLSRQALAEAGISENLIRFSAGIENINDLTKDILSALKKI
ncbi:MAG: O-acetylhomoserine aminocarboxypropyltransferase/cysteine synthase [Clostridia bacterium]|nr:O-acetylhomoserine aminocarboxypropyltransferase/cysteine synthase [Clostridia bacterium]